MDSDHFSFVIKTPQANAVHGNAPVYGGDLGSFNDQKRGFFKNKFPGGRAHIDAFKKMFLEVTRKDAIMQSFATDVPVPLAMFDKDLNYVAVSNRWKEEFSMNNIELIGNNLFTISPSIPKERKEIYCICIYLFTA